MLTFAVITHEELIVKTCPKADFLNFLEDNVGVHFGYRRHNDMVVIENNLLEELNVLATKLLGATFYDTVVVLNEQNEEYQSLSKDQLESLFKNYKSKTIVFLT
jgi:hypothetical protein